MNEILKQIRTDLRLSMNGIVSTSMREKGMDYKLNFGVDILRLRQIAQKYTSGIELAEMLWKENTRELKILATMLYPPASLTAETADRWCVEIPNQEIREQACINLFQRCPDAPQMAHDWMTHADENIRITGYWLYARLCLAAPAGSAKIEMSGVFLQMAEDVQCGSVFLRQAALNALKFYGRQSQAHADVVLRQVAAFEHADDCRLREIFDALRFEFTEFFG